MSLAETKLDLIAWLSKLEDAQALDQIAQIKNQYLEEKYQKSVMSMTKEELRDSLAEAEVDYKKGRVVSQEELAKRIKEGRIL